jgi:hypothetical protein
MGRNSAHCTPTGYLASQPKCRVTAIVKFQTTLGRTKFRVRVCQTLSADSAGQAWPPRLRHGARSSCGAFSSAVGVPGLEPGTSALSELRSSQLSYTPLWGNKKAKPTQVWPYPAQDKKDRASPRLAGVDGNQNHEHLNQRVRADCRAERIIGALRGLSTENQQMSPSSGTTHSLSPLRTARPTGLKRRGEDRPQRRSPG